MAQIYYTIIQMTATRVEKGDILQRAGDEEIIPVENLVFPELNMETTFTEITREQAEKEVYPVPTPEGEIRQIAFLRHGKDSFYRAEVAFTYFEPIAFVGNGDEVHGNLFEMERETNGDEVLGGSIEELYKDFAPRLDAFVKKYGKDRTKDLQPTVSLPTLWSVEYSYDYNGECDTDFEYYGIVPMSKVRALIPVRAKL